MPIFWTILLVTREDSAQASNKSAFLSSSGKNPSRNKQKRQLSLWELQCITGRLGAAAAIIANIK
jgi:hypothetical protein